MLRNLKGTFLTVTEGAEELGIDRSLMARYCRDGRIPGLRRHGRSWMIPYDQLQEFKRIPRERGNPNFRVNKKQKRRRR